MMIIIILIILVISLIIICIRTKINSMINNNISSYYKPLQFLYNGASTKKDLNTPDIFDPDFISMQYNLFCRPHYVSHDGQRQRMNRIPDVINEIKPDVVSFCELYDDIYINTLFKKLEEFGYIYNTTKIYGSIFKLSGGIFMVSRWPIIDEDNIKFEDVCNNLDCFTNKGVLYIKIIKHDKIFHIFSTHLQNGYYKFLETQIKQLLIMKEFVLSKNIPYSEPVIFQGDFNMHLKDLSYIFDILNVYIPDISDKYSMDPSTNILVGRDGDFFIEEKCNKNYTESWGKKGSNLTYTQDSNNKLHDKYCLCCDFELYDLVLASKNHIPPVLSTFDVLPIKTKQSFKVPWKAILQPVSNPLFVHEFMELYDLSDHYPVIAKYKY
jgi:hypothetical protein